MEEKPGLTFHEKVDTSWSYAVLATIAATISGTRCLIVASSWHASSVWRQRQQQLMRTVHVCSLTEGLKAECTQSHTFLGVIFGDRLWLNRAIG